MVIYPHRYSAGGMYVYMSAFTRMRSYALDQRCVDVEEERVLSHHQQTALPVPRLRVWVLCATVVGGHQPQRHPVPRVHARLRLSRCSRTSGPDAVACVQEWPFPRGAVDGHRVRESPHVQNESEEEGCLQAQEAGAQADRGGGGGGGLCSQKGKEKRKAEGVEWQSNGELARQR